MPRALWTAWVWAVISVFTEGEQKLISEEDLASDQASSLSCDPTGVCDGHSRSLNSIPSGLTAGVKSLDLSDNEITYVGNRDLQRCVNLKTLRLGANEIHTVEEDSFFHLRNLEYLDLSYNRLSNLSSSWFRSLYVLKFLNLLGNLYKTLGETSLFSHLPNLRTLKVGNSNSFTQIHEKDFTGLTFLEELEISAQNLQLYVPKSLKSIQNISHLILHLKQPVLLLDILIDIVSSLDYLELRDTNLHTFYFSEASISEVNTSVKKLIFRNVQFTDESFVEVVKLFNYVSGILEVEFDDCTHDGIGDFTALTLNRIRYLGNVETLTIRKLHIPQFFLFYDLSSIYPLTGKVKRVTIENSKVFLVPCLLSQHLKSLEYLDLSENLMSEETLRNSACEHAWPFLQTLVLRQNRLKSLEKTGELLLTLKNLNNLDISKNNFLSMPETCQWPGKMKQLNLSSTRIHSLTQCLPQTLEILDVSNNNLDSFSLILPQLKELYISRNKLKTLPDASFLPVLSVMRISGNIINTFSKEQLDSFPQLKALEAGGNNFICSCDFLSFTQGQQALARVLVDWPDGYRCDAPSHVRGQRVQDARLSLSECHRIISVSVVTVLLVSVVGVLVYKFYFHLMLLAGCKKYGRGESTYDAFVIYSSQDEAWVRNELVKNLEEGVPPFQLCLHYRDFIPGVAIAANIIQEGFHKSRKVIVVVSQHFIQSRWCIFEYEIAQTWQFLSSRAGIIFIVLQKLEKSLLRQQVELYRLLNRNTYLEWEDSVLGRHVFWRRLRKALLAGKPRSPEGTADAETNPQEATTST